MITQLYVHQDVSLIEKKMILLLKNSEHFRTEIPQALISTLQLRYSKSKISVQFPTERKQCLC